jgi:hypothetical protein
MGARHIGTNWSGWHPIKEASWRPCERRSRSPLNVRIPGTVYAIHLHGECPLSTHLRTVVSEVPVSALGR